MLGLLRSMFDGTLSAQPIRLTVVQSVIVTVLATAMAVALYLTVGVRYPGVGYQIFATLLIASILAPIFLYPSFRVASQLIAANTRIREQAFTDQLTGLPNSFALTHELGELVKKGTREAFAVHFLDITRFKAVNVGLGHEAGDEFLIAIGHALTGFVGHKGQVARFGGDEFVILQRDLKDPAEATQFAEQLNSVVNRSRKIGEHEMRLSSTIGTAIAPLDGNDPASLLKAANLALLSAKERSKAHEVFAPALAAAAKLRRDTEWGLQSALARNELFLLYQPIVSAKGGHSLVGLEALMRWRMADGTVAMPNVFIPVAESTGMIVEMGRWALRQACAECVKWKGRTRVAVNVSPIQFRQADLVDSVAAALAESGLEPSRLELEITESVLITDTAVVEPVLKRLRGMGIRIALDDFGSGFAGLNYLRRFMIDKIKVDKSIIDEAMTGERAANILRGVAKIAAESGLTVTVEGVDSFEKSDFVQREQCADEMQGFLFGRPLDAAMVPLMIATSGETPGKVVPFTR